MGEVDSKDKQLYAKSLGVELDENKEWPARCGNCQCWGLAPMDEPRKLEGTDTVMMPCRMAPPHIIWIKGHLIDTAEDTFGFAQWPYTAEHWCCRGWKLRASKED